MIRTEGLSKKFRKVKDGKQKSVNKKTSFEFYAAVSYTPLTLPPNSLV